MTLEQLKARMNEIKDQLRALHELTPRNEEERETILEQAGKLQAEGKRLGERFRLLLKQAQQGINQ